MAQQIKVEIHTEYIKMEQMLKLENIVSSGGEARFFIEEENILVNGEPEKRRGKKLRAGDIIEIKKQSYLIVNKEDE